jgi:hypothetical protein
LDHQSDLSRFVPALDAFIPLGGVAMGYVVKLEVYQGPFDLLLDLIAKNEVDIWDIPIATIARIPRRRFQR